MANKGAARPTATRLDAPDSHSEADLFAEVLAVGQAPASMNSLITGEILGD